MARIVLWGSKGSAWSSQKELLDHLILFASEETEAALPADLVQLVLFLDKIRMAGKAHVVRSPAVCRLIDMDFQLLFLVKAQFFLHLIMAQARLEAPVNQGPTVQKQPYLASFVGRVVGMLQAAVDDALRVPDAPASSDAKTDKKLNVPVESSNMQIQDLTKGCLASSRSILQCIAVFIEQAHEIGAFCLIHDGKRFTENRQKLQDAAQDALHASRGSAGQAWATTLEQYGLSITLVPSNDDWQLISGGDVGLKNKFVGKILQAYGAKYSDAKKSAEHMKHPLDTTLAKTLEIISPKPKDAILLHLCAPHPPPPACSSPSSTCVLLTLLHLRLPFVGPAPRPREPPRESPREQRSRRPKEAHRHFSARNVSTSW